MEKKAAERYEKLLKRIYYEDGKPFGRDGLFLEAKNQNPDDYPPVKFVGDWLRKQELQQLYSNTRKGGSVDRFVASRPWQEMSVDLIDFTNKPARNYRYILVAIDNFSRYMFAEPITSKKSKPTKSNPQGEDFAPSTAVAKAMGKILDKIKSQFNAKPKVIMSDDGGEFKAEYVTLLNQRNIKKKRTLGGQPQSNGLVERANGKIKMLLKKNRLIHGGTWVDELPRSVNAYNDHFIRTIQATPKQAVKYNTKAEQSALRASVEASRRAIPESIRKQKEFEVGDFVRVKLAKGKLSKQSDQSWSDKIYKVGKVIPARGTTATKYKIEGRDQDQSYSRNDLLKVDPSTVEPIPVRPTKPRTEIVIENGTPTEVAPREKSKRGRVVKITEMPDWRKGKIIYAKYPVQSSSSKKELEWYEARIIKRTDKTIQVQFTLDNIKKMYNLNDYRNGMLSDKLPENADGANKTPE